MMEWYSVVQWNASEVQLDDENNSSSSLKNAKELKEKKDKRETGTTSPPNLSLSLTNWKFQQPHVVRVYYRLIYKIAHLPMN